MVREDHCALPTTKATTVRDRKAGRTGAHRMKGVRRWGNPTPEVLNQEWFGGGALPRKCQLSRTLSARPEALLLPNVS